MATLAPALAQRASGSEMINRYCQDLRRRLLHSARRAIITLYHNADKPLPQWPFKIFVNAVLSVYAWVLRSSLMFVASSYMGQLHPLRDRYTTLCGTILPVVGPGALLWLWKSHLRQPLTAFGAIITILGIALDPFFQQLTKPLDCTAVYDNRNATLPRTNLFDFSMFEFGDVANTTGPTIEAVVSLGIFSPSSAHAILEQSNEIEKCDEELSEWYRGLDPCSRYTPYVSGSVQKEEEADKIIRLHQSTLHMIFPTALGILHRPQVVRGSSNADAGGNIRKMSRQKFTDAAIQITQLAYDMQLQNQLRYLSTSSIPAFISAALIHLFEIRSTQEEVRNLSICRFFQCVHVLHQLQEMYASADYAVYFLESVIQKTGIQVPMLSLTYLPSSRGLGKSNASATCLPTTLHATSSSPADPTQKRYPTPSSSTTK
ncbi:fungal-specific transcription factor domain-containing protein [Penicillium frequentans]|uniref:Fungal-specific transcription factor domain-containing protein n=1 Tax=Penicillium frequentans TaxID=3151616 RepID=A0AAD6GKV0_9EURO|nr:fungal-specific transcription factor domain-containing protein [Penicillium glabrum]